MGDEMSLHGILFIPHASFASAVLNPLPSACAVAWLSGKLPLKSILSTDT